MKMRACVVACCLIAISAVPLGAAGTGDGTLAGGYSVLQERTAGVATVSYDRGWFGALSLPIIGWLDAAADVSGHSRRNLVGEEQRLHAFLGGVSVRFIRMSRLTARGQALVGLERFAEPGLSQNGVALQTGAALDLRVWRRIGTRVGADYRRVHDADAAFNEIRIAAGVMVEWGSRSPDAPRQANTAARSSVRR